MLAEKQCIQNMTLKSIQIVKILGERVGIRTRDPLIKSQMLYRLSYALPNWDALPRMSSG